MQGSGYKKTTRTERVVVFEKLIFQAAHPCAQPAAISDLSGDIIAAKTAGAELNGEGGSLDLGLYLYQVGLPGTTGVILRMAHLVTGDSAFSTDLTNTGHTTTFLIGRNDRTLSYENRCISRARTRNQHNSRAHTPCRATVAQLYQKHESL